MSYVEGKTKAKVISAWLIRQDGTEEYSDIVPSWDCAITNTEPYTTDIKNVKVNRQRETHVDSHIYNLSGQRLSKHLKGINIVNGKKVVMKWLGHKGASRFVSRKKYSYIFETIDFFA